MLGLTETWRAYWPSQCFLCHAWPSQPLCSACVAQFAAPIPRCSRCALALMAPSQVCGACLREPPPLDDCVAAVDYRWPWSDCIARFKFEDAPGWASTLACLMRAAPRAQAALQACDCVLPMPLSPARLAERGYNQALLLARELAPGKTDATLLLRTRDTPHQLKLSRRQRLHNLRGAFALEPQRATLVAGKRILLVDDVMTTGASLHSAAGALRAGGAAGVSALVLARTP